MLTMPSTALPCLSRTGLFAFRVVMLVFFISMFIWDGIHYKWANDMSRNASYLTHWAYVFHPNFLDQSP